MRSQSIVIAAAVLLLMSKGHAANAAEKAPAAAIFDFGMKSGGEQWTWLEKGLADMFTTHFVRGGIPVVARDEMEALAMKVHWVPELAQEKKELDDVKQQLKVSYLVTGVYHVRGGQITITAQIVSMATRKEVFRKEIAGPAADVLELQAKLAAQVLTFFGGGVAGQTLPELTPWTKSIPAARALYEGIHLYDQGRYGEAWLYFRRAAASDPEYTDATYWVARMYYFMDQFEHARLAYEKFIYSDTTHPRAGDAVQEYLHTYESLNPPAETLLALYARLSAAYPNLPIEVDKFSPRPMTNQRWLELREAQLRGSIGQHRRAVELAAVRRPNQFASSADLKIAGSNAQLHNMLTGEVVLPEMIAKRYGKDRSIAFTPERTEITVLHDQKTANVAWFVVSCPSGYAFKSLRAYLIGEGTTQRMGMHMHKDVYGDVPMPCSSMPFPEARDKGFLFDNLPRAGFFELHDWIYDPKEGRDPTTNVRGFRFVAELEKLAPHGTLEVFCDTTGDFRVDVDGRMGRWGSGLVGLVPAGEHTLRFYSAGKIIAGEPVRKTPYGEWTTTVKVEAGHVTRVVGHLPWAADSVWRGWNHGAMVGQGYGGYFLGQHPGWAMPSLQMDRSAIRLVWSYMGDLWWSESRDGERYSPPARLGIPVSTDWQEEYPRVLRDESGRFVLLFLSDRNALHERRPYVSWSRDFRHWSAPAMIVDRAVENFDIMQDRQGRFWFADAYDRRLTVSESRDLYQWNTRGRIDLPQPNGPLKIVQRSDGRFDLFSIMLLPMERRSQYGNSIGDNVGVYHSLDGGNWTPRRELVQLLSYRAASLSVLERDGKQMLAYFTDANRWEPIWLQFQQRAGEEYGGVTREIGGIGSQDATLGYHSKWGYVMAWATPRRFGWGNTVEGPFVMRGPSLDPVLARVTQDPADDQPQGK